MQALGARLERPPVGSVEQERNHSGDLGPLLRVVDLAATGGSQEAVVDVAVAGGWQEAVEVVDVAAMGGSQEVTAG